MKLNPDKTFLVVLQKQTNLPVFRSAVEGTVQCRSSTKNVRVVFDSYILLSNVSALCRTYVFIIIHVHDFRRLRRFLVKKHFG